MENKKLSREEKAALSQVRETKTMYRLLIASFVAALGIIGVNFLKPINRMAFFYEYILLPMVIMLAVLTVIMFVRVFWFSKNPKSDMITVFEAADLLVTFAGAFAVVASYYISTALDTIRIIGIVVFVLLRLIYVLSSGTAFALSLQCALGVLPMLALTYVSSDTVRIVLAVAASVTVLAVAVICTLRFAKGGRLFFYILAGVVIAASVLCALIPGVYIYAIFTVLAAYLVLMVVYAIESM